MNAGMMTGASMHRARVRFPLPAMSLREKMEASRYVGRLRERRGYNPVLLMEAYAAMNGDLDAKRRIKMRKRESETLEFILEFAERQAKANGVNVDFSSKDPAVKTLCSLWSMGFERELKEFLQSKQAMDKTCPTCGKGWQEGRDADCWNEFHALENKP